MPFITKNTVTIEKITVGFSANEIKAILIAEALKQNKGFKVEHYTECVNYETFKGVTINLVKETK